MTNNSAAYTIEPSTPYPGFTVGLITGGIIGAMVGLAFAPHAGADLRRSVAGAAKNLGAAASKRCQDASADMSDAVGQLANKAHAFRNDAADAVVNSAQDVARFATALKS